MRQLGSCFLTFTVAAWQVVRIRTRDIVTIIANADHTRLFSFASLLIRLPLNAVIHLLQYLALELGQDLVISCLIWVSHGCAFCTYVRSGIFAILEDLQA